MQITVCDKCREKIPGNTDFKARDVRLNRSQNIQVTTQVHGFDDLCYYCSTELILEAAEALKKEYDGSEEGRRRNKKKEKEDAGDNGE